MTSPDWLDEIAGRLYAWTPGPGDNWSSPQHDAEIIAHAPEDIARLVSEVKRLREVEVTLQAVEREVAEVYVILTGGRVSKANTLSSVVVGEAEAYNERTCVADAWDEGYRLGDDDGYLRAHSDIRGERAAPPATNPYRTEVSDGSE